ncbi:MAG: methyltransferase [Actinomycetota bacterium]|nr:methyltransferase [Actinomycetota bacterium]
MNRLEVPQGSFTLTREPLRPKDPLRAWDAADELVLRHIDSECAEGGSVLIVNDAHGALSTALAHRRPTTLTDSYVSVRAIRRNLAANDLADDSVTVVDPLATLPRHPSLVVVRVPRTLAMLEFELRRLARVVTADTVVVGAAMAKHIHTSTLEAFDRILGPTTTSRATRKARLIHCTPSADRAPEPETWPTTYSVEPGPITVVNQASGFSPTRLDAGTALLLEHLPEVADGEHVVDLGCGNGIVGTVVALDSPGAEVTFIDESYLAVDSARATYRANVGPRPDDTPGEARFVVGDGIAHLSEEPPIPGGSIDLVLNNPPFHTDNALGDATAWQMFSDARVALRTGGELWVVGNRHLAYHAKLKRLFGNCDVVASNPKFVVYRAVRR